MKSRALSATALLLAATFFGGSQASAADQAASSAFLQCDGRTGHVSGGERFLRLLLVSATAGLSEAGMSRDSAEKRAKGAAGVAACDQAMASEGDAYRRMQLALSRSLHYGEDKQWAAAAAAASAVPQQLGAKASDWGLSKSATSTARYLQAIYLVRAGKVAEGEATAWEGARIGGLDVLTLQRTARFITLSRTVTPEKRAVLRDLQRYYPDAALRVSMAYAEAGEFKAASEAAAGLESSFAAFLKEPKPASNLHSMLATYAALDGDVAKAKSELAIAKTALDRDRAEGDAASEPTNFSAREEIYAFAEAAIAAGSGDSAQAAKLISARGSWPAIAPGVVAILVGRVSPKIPESARVGLLAKSDQQLWQEALEARLALFNNTDHDDKLWGVTGILEQDEGYQRLARAALTGSGKSKWLLKQGKEPRDFDILLAGPEAGGWEAGEGILYHAALMAKARGKDGFVLLPKRDRINWVGLRFVNPGEFGIPESSVVKADDVIGALSQHIRASEQ